MSDRTLKGLIGLVVAGLVAVIAVGAVFGASAAADDLRDRSQTALDAAGLDAVAVDFHGREAELSGGNDVEIRLARTLVSALPGVRRVDLDRDADTIVENVARFELDRAGDVVQIGGTVPNPDDAAEIKVAVAAGLRTMVTGDLVVDPSLPVVSWAAALPDALRTLSLVEDLELDIPGDGTIVLGGTVSGSAERDRLVRQIGHALPGLEVVSHLSISARTAEGS